jgi:hypothetical protein
MTRTMTFDRVRNAALLGVAGIGAAGALALGPATSASATEVPVNPAAAPVAPVQADLDVVGTLQPNGYYCGPAATRIALSAHGEPIAFDALADELGTTREGTRSVDDITRVLNAHTGEGRYTSVKLQGADVSDEQTEKFRADVMAAVGSGDAVVANIVGQVTDTDGEKHAYMGGHYVTVTGYNEDARTVTITDPADKKGSNEYQLPIDEMADWMATRGYSH